MLRPVKTIATVRFAQRFAKSFKVADRKAITNGIHQKSVSSSNIPCPITIFPDINPSITPGSMENSIQWADIDTAIKTQSTEILILKIGLSIIYDLHPL